MKKIYPLSLLFCMTFLFIKAQTTYTISANTSYTKAKYPSYCSSCTFNIASGVTLTLDNASATCANCTFKGGDVSVTSNYVCQTCSFTSEAITMTSSTLTLLSGTTSFSSVVLTANGNGSITANAPVSLSSSHFYFNNNTYFLNNGGTLSMNASIMDFYNSAYFLANAGPVNLQNSSTLVAGNGTTSSTAYIEINSPTLNLYDNSAIGVAGFNNYYFNWNSYNSMSNNKSYSTYSNTSNCGQAGENKCTLAKVFGPVTLNKSGIVSYNLLPVVLEGFQANKLGNESIGLTWKTEQELNANYFTVLRSSDASQWEPIGTVKAKGNSETETDYSFTDQNPLPGNNYYRLEMVDLNNSAALSETVHLDIQDASGQAAIFPNPVTNGQFNLQVPQTGTINIRYFTMEGKLLQTQSLQGQLIYTLEMPASAPHNSAIALQILGLDKTQTIIVMVR